MVAQRTRAGDHARWGPVDGFRIAYVAGAALRIVNGDGTGDHRHARIAPGVAPAWRPDDAHVLAFVDGRARVTVVAVDTRRRLWRSAPLQTPAALAWSSDGSRLLAATRDRLVLFDGAGRRLRSSAAPGMKIAHVAAVPQARGFVVVRRGAADGTGEVVLVDERLGERRVFSGPGDFGEPAWAPDAGALLVPWPAADQWLFLRPRGHGRPAAVGSIARQFAPGAVRPPFPRTVEWCCWGNESGQTGHPDRDSGRSRTCLSAERTTVHAWTRTRSGSSSLDLRAPTPPAAPSSSAPRSWPRALTSMPS